MGSRSKGPRREVTQFQYYRGLDKGPIRESKLARRVRRATSRETFSTGLAKEFAVAAQSKSRRRRLQLKRTGSGVAVAWPESASRQSRQEPLCRVVSSGVSQRVLTLFRRVVRAERLQGRDTQVEDLAAAWNRLTHREKGVFRKTLVRRAEA